MKTFLKFANVNLRLFDICVFAEEDSLLSTKTKTRQMFDIFHNMSTCLSVSTGQTGEHALRWHIFADEISRVHFVRDAL